MDLFGRKRIAQLQDDLAARDEDVTTLKTALREQDQLIYNMSQMNDWNGMRPYFVELQAATEHRRLNESDRIASTVLRELNKA